MLKAIIVELRAANGKTAPNEVANENTETKLDIKTFGMPALEKLITTYLSKKLRQQNLVSKSARAVLINRLRDALIKEEIDPDEFAFPDPIKQMLKAIIVELRAANGKTAPNEVANENTETKLDIKTFGMPALEKLITTYLSKKLRQQNLVSKSARAVLINRLRDALIKEEIDPDEFAFPDPIKQMLKATSKHQNIPWKSLNHWCRCS
ncbi:hypothetical protein HELRODRAFT_166923 [Helobdella robusta]|uniref:SAP domain-containing protein n=1 Tax=Helobdella robusta TaxID=6412 RepID=T1EYR5_HELRO|nr:hypothetical protein HELRODRAFT_166923 [Helobdella robusta]ESO11852.1 hypothetical protein HELRODRAFT_166923 [Helobdella robusta]